MAPQVIVVGAGIIGASAAYHLQKSGADVTVLDAGHAGATQASFGWINASFFENPDYYRLRVEGMAAYRDLVAELALPVAWCGCLCWEETGDAFDAQRDALRGVGYDAEEIDAAGFASLEPHVADPPERALKFAAEGAAESVDLAARLLEAAVALGARVIAGVAVTGFDTAQGRVTGVQTSAGPMTADHVVMAVGTATAALLAQVDAQVPMLKRPALVLKTRPTKPILTHVLASKIGEVRQLPDGALLMPAAVNHQGDASEQLDAPVAEIADAALQRLQAMLPDVPLEWARSTVAYRPVPKDGLPVVGGAMDGLYVATMHSGITLGALMGQQIAVEVLNGPTNETAKRLAPYRPDRFST